MHLFLPPYFLSLKSRMLSALSSSSMVGFKKRRLLTDDLNAIPASSLGLDCKKPNAGSDAIEYAKLVTVNENGGNEAIILCPDMPVVIGRNKQLCSYVINKLQVSNVHCKFYAVLSSNGGVIVSCQDMSTNGIKINGYKLRKAAAIVMDGDEIEIPFAKKFKCIHILKGPIERMDIFEPTPPQGAYKNLNVGRYTVMSHCLGSGSFASVHLAFDTVSQKQVACKTIVARGKDRKDMQNIMKEVNILRGLQHPNVNQVLDVDINEKNGWLHIFLELCTGGDLFTYISSRQQLREGEAKYMMYQLLKGIEYLHDRHVSHRDLKPENIMLFTPGPYPRIQIADFGLAREKAYQETRNVCGTVAYLPPEGVLALDKKELGYLGMPSDCWSAGVILYIMLSGGHPFDYQEADESDEQSFASQFSQDRLSQFSQGSIVSEQVVKERIVFGHIDFVDEIWSELPDAKRLIGRLMVYDHKYRETVYGALRSTWITSDLEDLEGAYKERIGS